MRHSVAFNLELYSLETIQLAAKEYLEFCSLQLEQRETDILCTFFSDTVPADLIGLEFGNYLIELMQQGVRA